MAEIAFLPGGEGDYQDALDRYAARSSRATVGYEAAIELALRAIGEAPGRWPRCDDRHRFYGLKRFPFRIIDRVEAGDVLVVALAHSSRSASYWQDCA